MTINFGAAYALLRSCTMATRYAVCRRQFANYKDSKVERRLIDYQTHLFILGPNISNAFVIYLTGRIIEQLINDSNVKVEEGDFKLLDILHHFTSGMKSISTEMMYKGTDELRSSCGGAGFHVASGLVTGFTDHAPLATFEGVNTLMS